MPKIEFGSDRIRGIAGEWPLTQDGMKSIGQALGQFVRRQFEHPVAVIGRDTRVSGAELLPCLVDSLTGQGVDVVDLGVMTTPGVAFLTRRLQANLGVVISASHSPPEYNGLKIVGPNGLRLQREEEVEIERAVERDPFPAQVYLNTRGQRVNCENLIELYVRDHVERCPALSLSDLRVVLDCANGAAARVAPDAFRELGADVTVIYAAAEGVDINRQCGSEHAREYPEVLAATVRQHDAVLGFAFDGDGDRLTVVDSAGRMYDGNDLLFVLAVYYQARGQLRGNTVVTTHLANGGLFDALNSASIQTVRAAKGDKYLEAAMWGGDYLLGSEPVGNIIINDGYHTAADAVYAALVLGGVIVCSRPLTLAQMAAPLCKRPQVTRTLNLQASPELERMAQTESVRWQAVLGIDSRALCWGATTEPGRFRVMVEGSCDSTPAQVSQVAEVICKALLAADCVAHTIL